MDPASRSSGLHSRPLKGAVDLATLDFRHAEFDRELSLSDVDEIGITLHAIKVGEKVLVSRTLLTLRLVRMPGKKRRAQKLREKNLIFTDRAAEHGIPVPYAKVEYEALTRKQRKAVLATAGVVQEYNRLCAQLTALQILKSDQPRLIERMRHIEAQLLQKRALLPTTHIWKDYIREK